MRVHLVEWLTGVPVEQCDGCAEEAFLFPPGAGAAVGAISQIRPKAVDLIRLALAAKGLTFARSPATRRSHAPGSR
jgi:hypothetical protein